MRLQLKYMRLQIKTQGELCCECENLKKKDLDFNKEFYCSNSISTCSL